jgi:hypothetical protein
LNKNGSRDYMKGLVGLPYLRDVSRKARSGSFGPFVRHEYFPIITVHKKGRKRRKDKEKGGRKYKSLQLQKQGRKTSREEKTQHN